MWHLLAGAKPTESGGGGKFSPLASQIGGPGRLAESGSTSAVWLELQPVRLRRDASRPKDHSSWLFFWPKSIRGFATCRARRLADNTKARVLQLSLFSLPQSVCCYCCSSSFEREFSNFHPEVHNNCHFPTVVAPSGTSFEELWLEIVCGCECSLEVNKKVAF